MIKVKYRIKSSIHPLVTFNLHIPGVVSESVM